MKILDLLKKLSLFISITFLGVLISNLFPGQYNKLIVIIICIAFISYAATYFIHRSISKNITNKSLDITGFFLTERGRKFIATMEVMGIHDVFSKLRGSEADPRNIVKSVKKSLYFMGGTASKWRDMEALNGIAKLQADNVEIKFLLFNPESKNKQEFFKLRQLEASNTYFMEFMNRNKNVEIRVFDFLPHIRLNIIDNKVMYVYSYYDHNANYSFGEETPVIKLLNDSEIQKPLYEAFQKYFENVWSESKQIIPKV